MADPATYTKGSWTDLLPAATKAKLENIENGIKANNDALVAETDAGRAMTQAADAAAQRALLNVEDGADVTDEANVTAIAVATDEVTAAPDHIWGLVGGALKRWTKAGFEAVVRAFSATTAAAGTVMLATTGIEAATKVPKATGAEIAALLTAGGYTLTAPSGANSLDGIADTATWKKVAAAVATALNASKLPLITGVTDLNSGVADNCVFTCAGNPTGGPVDLSYSFPTGIQIIQGNSLGYNIQIIHENTTESLYIRYCDGGSWPATWRKLWSNFNDGNGGQPPAAKSNQTSDATIGWFDAVDCASGASVTLPAGGTFEWFVATYGATYNSVTKGESAGGAMTGTASANLRMYYKRKTA